MDSLSAGRGISSVTYGLEGTGSTLFVTSGPEDAGITLLVTFGLKGAGSTLFVTVLPFAHFRCSFQNFNFPHGPFS